MLKYAELALAKGGVERKKLDAPKPKSATDILSLEELTMVMGSERDAKALLAEVDADGSARFLRFFRVRAFPCSLFLIHFSPLVAATAR